MFEQMGLTLAEHQHCQAAVVVSGLRKHPNASISAAAKKLRTFWKDQVKLIDGLYMS